MKKIFTVVLMIAILIFPCTVKAEEQTAKFEGFVFPVREFYSGEYANGTVFKIDGVFVDRITNKIIPLDEWKIYAIESVQKDYINVTFKYMPDMGNTNSKYSDINYQVPVKVNEFNPNLQRQVKGTIYTSETDLSKVFNQNDFIFKNSLKQRVLGDLQYDKVKLKSGINVVNYRFKPYKELITSYGYEKYNIQAGKIKIIVE